MSIKWINDLSGSQNMHSSPMLLGENESELLLNTSQAQDGALSNRNGTKLFLNAISASPIKGLHAFEKQDGTQYLHMVNGGNLYTYANTGGVWPAAQVSAIWNTNSNINMVNYNGKHYFASDTAGEYLMSGVETGALSIVAGNLDGNLIGVSGAYMMIGGGFNNPLKIYFSGVATDTFNTNTDYFQTLTPPTAIASFANGRPFVIFTQNNILICDPATLYSTQIDGFGCTSQRSVQSLRGNLIWLSKDGFFILNNISAYPQELSLPIRNDVTGDAVINQINGTNYKATASGIFNNKYYCALQSLVAPVKGQTITNCIVEYDFAQQTWKTHSYPSNQIASVFALFIDNTGTRNLYAGSLAIGAVYKFNIVGVSQDDNSSGVGQSFTSVINSKHYDFNEGAYGSAGLKKVDYIYFKYYSASPITVSFSLDGSTTYTAFPNPLPIFTANRWTWQMIEVGKECKTIGLQFQCAGQFTIFTFGFEVEDKRDRGLKGI